MCTKKIILFLLVLILVSFKIVEENHPNLIEKVYTQTDRPLYFPGETIWFKSYITNAENKISTISDIMYTELISPKGSIIKTINLSIHQGYAYGDFEIGKNWVGGIYKIRTYTNWMKNFGEESIFEKELIVQKVINPNLLLNLKFDKEAYGKNSNVIGYFEVKDLKNNPLSNKKIKINLTLQGKSILSKELVTDTSGKLDIKFQLPGNLNTTDAILNVLIPHKGTTESISRSVPIILNKIDLQFMPESGSTIIGTKNTIAFKAMNEFGKPADISGEIVTINGALIANFTSYHDGMGSFNFIPKAEQYFAKITAPFKSDSLIPLPKIELVGTKFSIKNKSNKYIVDIYSNNEKNLHIKISNAYKTILNKSISVRNNKASFAINENDLSSGIIKISLLNDANIIVAERLAFVNESNQLKIAITLDKETYSTREKVTVKIKTTDINNTPIPSNLSVSITDNKLISFADDKQDNINSYLLVSSELNGKIHKPSFYFDKNEPKAAIALDYLMLTHGWRKYINENNLTFENSTYIADTKATQYGQIVDKESNPTKAHLLLFDQNSDKVIKFDTDDFGNFSFKINKTKSLILLAYTDDEKKLTIKKNKFVKGTNSTEDYEVKKNENDKGFDDYSFNKPLQKDIKQKVTTPNNVVIQLDANADSLDEVIVTGYGYISRANLSGVVTIVLEENIAVSNNDNIGELLNGRVAGINVIQNSGQPGSTTKVTIRGASSIVGNSQPLIVVDGVPYNYNDKTSSAFNNIEPSNIESVNVLKGASASAIYGSRGINGVIIVSTKNQNFNNKYGYKSINNKKYHNYATESFYLTSGVTTYTSKQFYIPIYNSDEISENRTDFRQTIYWNPVIQTDENGEATFEYYNSDAVTSFIITTEGIGYNGLVGRNETEYATKKLLNIDFKTPNYMALNDTIQLPITITNESFEETKIKIELELPKELKLIKGFDKSSFSIEPNSYQTKTITIIPIEETVNANINIIATSNKYSDNIRKQTTIISPFFPTSTSISGFKNDSFEFDVNNVIDGSLNAELSIYTDIVGDVMDGIESLIRQPYGCFEQVSASTYPNILVLKYLKESGRSNPKIEKLAMNYIKKGYKKLAGYETSMDGFEWYGHTPPHEALSAYGLLEFMEMRDVYEGVSQPMINRTIKFLMSRKNGNGGFKQNRGKYGFSAAPKNVNNAYIVYAISESGVDVDIEKEYNFTFNEALNSNDSYRMALLACASFNLNKNANATLLIKKIKNNIDTYGFDKLPVNNTITRSYGDSKQIETAAFTILALLKDKDSEYSISQGVEYIISQRKHNRFGSTQSTSMALKALIEYTKTQKNKIIDADNSINITINNEKISEKLSLNEDGKIVIKNLEKYMSSGKQTIKIEFSDSNVTFPYNLNVKWKSMIPDSSNECNLELETTIQKPTFKVGENIRMNILVKNKTDNPLPMATAIIGIPSGSSAQAWQLKEILEKNKIDYYEIFDNYLVFYWKEFDQSEIKEIQLDLKAEIPGNYQAPASTVYLYYADEFKHWIKGNKVEIKF